MNKVSGIYTIVHAETGRCYIGSSTHIHGRWTAHRKALLEHRHHSVYLQRAWNKYGANAFAWGILSVVPTGIPVEDLRALEENFLKVCQPAYNRFFRASGWMRTPEFEEKRIRNLRSAWAALKGTQRRTPEQRARINAAVKIRRPRPAEANARQVKKMSEWWAQWRVARAEGRTDRQKIVKEGTT